MCACLMHCNGDAHILRSGEIFLLKEIYLFICFVDPFTVCDLILFLFYFGHALFHESLTISVY